MKSKGKAKPEKVKEPPRKQSFEERFKDKKQLIGKAGLLGVFDIRQPFDLNAQIEPHPGSPKNPERDHKLSLTQHEKKKIKEEANFRTNKTELPPKSHNDITKDSEDKKVKLPKISKSHGNLKGFVRHVPVSRKLSTSELWNVDSKKKKTVRKRAASELGLISLIK